MCPDRTQCRQGPPDAADATRYGARVQDAQDAQDPESRLGQSGRNTTVSDADHLFAEGRNFQVHQFIVEMIVGKVLFHLKVINDIIHCFGRRTEEDGGFSLR